MLKLKNYSALTFLFFFIGLSLTFNNTFAQFGKNKVQYKVFDWKYIQTKHFDIYFSQGGNDLAEYTAIVAESHP